MTTSALSNTCSTAYDAVLTCMKSTSIPDTCSKCADSTNLLLTKCNRNDLKSETIWPVAIRCHKEDDQVCAADPNFIERTLTCPDKCAQFISKMVLKGNSTQETEPGQREKVEKCAALYQSGNDTQNDNSTNSDASSSANTFVYSILTVSTLLLV
eukprot:NODE_1177_length_1893_cov_0.764771.p2 type:complete len:155 gc:universal NODE_1177_length_1893_cov_0.764771:939-475(-)